ncbi:MAG TPA: hypothetical protein VH500_25590 [Nitrososphaeraceae archaeon]
MSTTISAEASKPPKKMQECNRCKASGFPNQLIGFDKMGVDPETGKSKWKLIDENGLEHIHKFLQSTSLQPAEPQIGNDNKPIFRRRRVIDIATTTNVDEARTLFASGWELYSSYPATIANIPHYVLVKRESSEKSRRT